MVCSKQYRNTLTGVDMSKKDSNVWANMIVEYGEIAPDQLLANPRNFRRHPGDQRDALRGSLNELGIIAPVVINRQTGNMIDGHARVEEYLSAGVQKVPYVMIDVPPEKEALALLSLDPIAAMAESDKEALDELLRDANTSEEGLQKMLAELAKQTGLYQDTDDLLDGEQIESGLIAFQVAVVADTPARRDMVAEVLRDSGFEPEVTVLRKKEKS